MDNNQTVSQLGITTILKTDMLNAEAQVAAALKAEGFGVLTEIDVKATLKQKLDVDFRPYKILGACNPRLAHRALTTAPQIGLLLPCNITLSQIDENTVEVSAIEPLTMLGVIDNPELASIATEAHERLTRAISSLEG
jgi:uncharacterized protein (DUF302 family)